jgi:hypothetical protein
MHRIATIAAVAALTLAALTASADAQQAADPARLSFFVTSVGNGKGADFGGLPGADAHCQSLAGAVGAGARSWRAYLSTQAVAGQPAVNARDRIGAGPWTNAKGEIVARDVAHLHGENNLTKQTALSEKGEVVPGRGDPVNMHDILTGSQPDGTAFAAGEDRTCGNWTLGGTTGSAMLGHHDRTGLDTSPPALSWNSSHPSRSCNPDGLRATGGAGLLYCFAAN